MTNSPSSEGGRRSRRGLYYQDLFAIRCTLEMLGGRWHTVTSEGADDVECIPAQDTSRWFFQVKTIEQATQHWSVAKLCATDDHDIAKSILGRLFSPSLVPDGSRFVLVVNEGLQDELRPLELHAAGGHDCLDVVQNIAHRLWELVPPSGRTVSWCVDRFSILCLQATADDLEAELLSRTIPAWAKRTRNLRLLADECEGLLDRLVILIGRTGRVRRPVALSPAAVESVLNAEIDKFDTAAAGATGDSDILRQKLKGAGLDSQEAEGAVQSRLHFTGKRRRAVGKARNLLDEIATEIRTACLRVKARRLSGETAPGYPSLAAVLDELRSVHSAGNWAARGVTMADAIGVLHDVTARCQNRYA